MARVGIRYADRKAAVREILIQRARENRTITYSELGKLVHIPAQGPWKPLLDEMSREETANRLPDLTYLVVNKDGLPGQIGFRAANPPTAEQRQMAMDEIQRVFTRYGRKPAV